MAAASSLRLPVSVGGGFACGWPGVAAGGGAEGRAGSVSALHAFSTCRNTISAAFRSLPGAGMADVPDGLVGNCSGSFAAAAFASSSTPERANACFTSAAVRFSVCGTRCASTCFAASATGAGSRAAGDCTACSTSAISGARPLCRVAAVRMASPSACCGVRLPGVMSRGMSGARAAVVVAACGVSRTTSGSADVFVGAAGVARPRITASPIGCRCALPCAPACAAAPSKITSLAFAPVPLVATSTVVPGWSDTLVFTSTVACGN
jgi:hypothetical protein